MAGFDFSSMLPLLMAMNNNNNNASGSLNGYGDLLSAMQNKGTGSGMMQLLPMMMNMLNSGKNNNKQSEPQTQNAEKSSAKGTEGMIPEILMQFLKGNKN